MTTVQTSKITYQKIGVGLLFLITCVLAFLPLLLQLIDGTNNIHVALLYDDAYYYARMAASYHNGHGFSFNDIEQTNGFQPLWMFVVALLSELVGSEPLTLFLSYVALVAILNIFWICFFARLFQHQVSWWAAWLIPLFLMLTQPQIYMWGMETLLAIPALYYLAARLINHKNQYTNYIGTGLALAWLFLARLDSLVLMPVLVIWAIRCERAKWHALAPMVAPALITACIYFACNQYWYGSPVPVSGLAKSLGAPHFANFSVFAYALYLLFNPKTILFLLAWVLSAFLTRHKPTKNANASLVVFLVAIVMQFGYYACFSGWAVWPWYGYLTIGFWVVLIVSLLSTPIAWPNWKLVRTILYIFMLAMSARGAWQLWPGHIKYDDFAQRNLVDAQSGVFSGKTIIMGDRAGSLGYWTGSSTHIVQTEGLVMSKGFLESKLVGKGLSWIDDHYAVDEVVIDRAWLPTFGTGQDTIYLVIEPIQPRIWQNQPIVMCFPQSAVLAYKQGPEFVRARFAYRSHVDCSTQALNWLNQMNAKGLLSSLSLKGFAALGPIQSIDYWLASHLSVRPTLVGPNKG